jgi:hypothetical protein
VNERIAFLTHALAEDAARRGRDAIVQRLTELDHEWDIDRVLMANFAVAGGVAYAVGLKRYSDGSLFGARPKGFLGLLGAQLGFLMLHAAVGWCPPVSLWRRLGVRTKNEIEAERLYLLEALDSAKRSERDQALPPAAAGLLSPDAAINQ